MGSPVFFVGRLADAARRCARLIALVACLGILSACQAGPPVQEMSDARQAIAVAREAGAEELASDELREAEASLQRAEDSISRKSYAAARRDALSAKESALDALSIADKSRDQQQ